MGQKTGKKQTFNIHKDLICERSPFFKAACSKDWLEASEKVVKLSEQCSRAFKIYIEWAYSQTSDIAGLAQTLLRENVGKSDNADIRRSGWQGKSCYLCRVWYFADYLGDRHCQNRVAGTLIKEQRATKSSLDGGTVREIWEKTAPGSKLHKWALDTVLPILTVTGLERQRGILPAEFLFLALRGLLEEPGKVDREKLPKELDACKYHEHSEEYPVCA